MFSKTDERPDSPDLTVFELNFAYLVSAYRAIKDGADDPGLTYGLTPEVIEWLEQATVFELADVARSPVVIFKLSLPPSLLGRMRARLRPADRWVTAMHAVLARSSSMQGNSDVG